MEGESHSIRNKIDQPHLMTESFTELTIICITAEKWGH